MDGAATDGDDLILLLPIVRTGLTNLLLEDVNVRIVWRPQVACNVQRLRLITSQNTLRTMNWVVCRIPAQGPVSLCSMELHKDWSLCHSYAPANGRCLGVDFVLV